MSTGVEYSYGWHSEATKFLVLGIVRDHDFFMAALETLAAGDDMAASELQTRVTTSAQMLTNSTVIAPLVQHALAQVSWSQAVEALRLAESRAFVWGTGHDR